MAWRTQPELEKLNFRSLGDGVLISTLCSLYGTECMRIGSNVRIDDFAIITAEDEVRIGSYVHISAQAFIAGTRGVDIGDFTGISVGAAVFSTSDDYSGEALVGPLIPEKYRKVASNRVRIGPHAVIGARSIVLPGVTIPEGTSVGCLSLVNRSLDPWTIYAGIPVRPLRPRSKNMLRLAADFMDSLS